MAHPEGLTLSEVLRQRKEQTICLTENTDTAKYGYCRYLLKGAFNAVRKYLAEQHAFS